MTNAMLRNYNPPWYERLVNGATDMVYGDDANAQEREWMNKLLGPQNPFNIPAQFSQGLDIATDGYNQGDYGQMAGGALQAGLAASPFFGAHAMRPAVRNARIARNKNAMFPYEPSAMHGRPQPRVDDFAVMRNYGRSTMKDPGLTPSNANFSGEVVNLPSRGTMQASRGTMQASPDELSALFPTSDGGTVMMGEAYKRFLDRGGNLSEQAFRQAMAEAGYRAARVGGRNRYIGVE